MRAERFVEPTWGYQAQVLSAPSATEQKRNHLGKTASCSYPSEAYAFQGVFEQTREVFGEVVRRGLEFEHPTESTLDFAQWVSFQLRENLICGFDTQFLKRSLLAFYVPFHECLQKRTDQRAAQWYRT